ncbi:hypothetical protein R3Q06_30955, partial [Rhodococcus erythropolis]|uniref:hypothetical protein n=1 Tax=Rhodococcus erythropolis TaxID=1833 RepID=UPI00294A5E58
MTDTELADEATRLGRQQRLNRCDEIRLALVKDELTSRDEKSRNPRTDRRDGNGLRDDSSNASIGPHKIRGPVHSARSIDYPTTDAWRDTLRLRVLRVMDAHGSSLATDPHM